MLTNIRALGRSVGWLLHRAIGGTLASKFLQLATTQKLTHAAYSMQRAAFSILGRHPRVNLSPDSLDRELSVLLLLRASEVARREKKWETEWLLLRCIHTLEDEDEEKERERLHHHLRLLPSSLLYFTLLLLSAFTFDWHTVWTLNNTDAVTLASESDGHLKVEKVH